MRQICGLLFTLLFAETVAEKKYCWYFEGDYPVYFICKTYEDCCGTQCCIRALAVQRIWYFWLLLIIAILCCCSTGYFIRRRVHPYPPPDRPEFTVTFSRNPIIAPVTALSYYSQTPHHPPPSYEQVMQDTQKKSKPQENTES